MKKKYLAIVLLLIFSSMFKVSALTIGDCKVLASYKLYSSLDEENYICKGKSYGKNGDAIYYPGSGDIIYLNNLDAYYLSSWEEYDVTVDITGKNNISMLHLSDSKFKVTGSGSLKFKQNSFVKKVMNGQAVYQYLYNDKTVLNSDKKMYEGMTLEFEENYELLKEVNDLPEEFNLNDYVLIQAVDYTKMTSVVVTESWIVEHINTDLKTSLVDGFGIVEYIKEETSKKEEQTSATGDKKESKKDSTKLETDNVVFISEKKVNKKYKLKEENLKEKEVANKVSKSIKNKDLVSFYDVSVYNGKKEVAMKNGKFTIKIKLDKNVDQYENYQIIYVNDDGEIEEYIDGSIEGDYIVFETSHLSQYGVIASPIINEVAIVKPVTVVNKSNDLGNLLKVSILLIFMLSTSILVMFLLLKSKLLVRKKKRKKA